MRLDADAAEYWATLHGHLVWPLNVLGVQAGRDLSLAAPSSGGPILDSVIDDVAWSPMTRDRVPVRVYRPVSSSPLLPVLLYLHGGGWSIGSLDGVDPLCRELAARAECVVVSVDYRQAPEDPFPAPLDDAWTALQWSVDNAKGLEVDVTRIAVGGDSAGGNLAAALTLKAREYGEPAISFQLLVYPGTESEPTARSRLDLCNAPVLTSADVDWFWNLYLPDREYRSNPLAVPARADDLRDLPDAAVLLAEFDPIRDDGVDYAARLADAGSEVCLRTYTGVFHGFFTLVGTLAKTDEAISDAASYLRRAFDKDVSR